jgi:putative DNA primase/helicase
MAPVKRLLPFKETAAALAYARQGKPVFPCGLDKKPLTPHGFKDATTDEGQIREWWERWPDASIGCPTGAGSGFWVLDIDLPEGPAALEEMEDLFGALPPTREQRTGGGGRQQFFLWPEGRGIRNSAGKIGPGLDVRGDGGYVILPPSGHPSGGRYTWTAQAKLAEAPAWLLNTVAPTATPASPAAKPAAKARNYAASALEREAGRVVAADPGARNDALNQAAFALGQLVAGGELDRAEVEAALTRAAKAAGLEAKETAATIKSGLLAGAEEPRTAPDNGPAIQIRDGQLPRLVDACEALLLLPDLPAEARIFQRGGHLVRCAVLPTGQAGCGVDRPAGAAVIQGVDRTFLQDLLGRIGAFEKYDRRRKEWVRTNLPREVADVLLSRKGFWKLPVLRGIVGCPTLRPDGSLLLVPGFDPASGYFLAGGLRVEVAEAPDHADAESALEALCGLLAGFAFVAEVDQAVALALLLTAVARPAIASTPIINISAPVRGSGKSTLVDVAAVLASGRRAAVLSATGDAGELEKRIVGCLLSGDPLVSLDNLNGQLASDLLCQASTADAVKIRPLGGSGQVEIENTTLWTANGNNLVTAGDLARRSLLCRMDPGVERPEERTFAFDPVARARQHRAAYVGHALTIMRAYVVAGRPDLELVPFGSFEVWSSLVRCALVWAGAADPCASRAGVLDEDPEAARLRALLAAWREAFGDDQKTVREVISTAQVGDGPLADALGDIAEEGTMRFNTQRLGIWLRRNMNRVAGGLKLQRAGTARDGAAWQVVEA